jgi:hypothetical protein
MKMTLDPYDFDVAFEYEDHAIQGKMVIGRAVLPEEYRLKALNDEAFKQEVRETLIQKLAEALYKEKLVEINQAKDPISGELRVIIRAFMTPDSQVRILRTVKR